MNTNFSVGEEEREAANHGEDPTEGGREAGFLGFSELCTRYRRRFGVTALNQRCSSSV